MLELTLTELENVQKQKLTELLEQVGGVNHLSKMLNIGYMNVKGWEDRGRISRTGAMLVEGHGSLGEHWKAIDLRPDLES